MKRIKLALFYIIFLIPLTACLPANDQSMLDESMKLWKDANISSYTFTYNQMCFCLPLNADITVVDNKVSEAYDVPTGVAFTAEELTQVHPIERYFEIIQNAITKEVDLLEVTYNKESGYPERIYINYGLEFADAGITYTLENFQ